MKFRYTTDFLMKNVELVLSLTIQGQRVFPVGSLGLSLWGRGLVTGEAAQDQESQGIRHERDKISGVVLIACSLEHWNSNTRARDVEFSVDQDEFLELSRLASGSFGSVVKVL